MEERCCSPFFASMTDGNYHLCVGLWLRGSINTEGQASPHGTHVTLIFDLWLKPLSTIILHQINYIYTFVVESYWYLLFRSIFSIFMLKKSGCNQNSLLLNIPYTLMSNEAIRKLEDVGFIDHTTAYHHKSDMLTQGQKVRSYSTFCLLSWLPVRPLEQNCAQ